MKLFIWDYVSNLTDNWHGEGGLVVIADSLERAREILGPKTGKDGALCEAMTTEPDLVRECDGPEHISIHPDAGCC